MNAITELLQNFLAESSYDKSEEADSLCELLQNIVEYIFPEDSDELEMMERISAGDY